MLNTVALIERFLKTLKNVNELELAQKRKKVFDTISSEFLLHLKKLYFPNIPAFIKVIFFEKLPL